MSDSQDRAEALDEDKVSSEYPPDEPWGVDEPEVTPEGEWAQESYEERSERHELRPDDDERAVHPYVDPSQDVLDDEGQAVAEAEPAGGDQYRLPGEDVPEAAEEAAIHIEE